MAPASIGASSSTSPATSLRPCRHTLASLKQVRALYPQAPVENRPHKSQMQNPTVQSRLMVMCRDKHMADAAQKADTCLQAAQFARREGGPAA